MQTLMFLTLKHVVWSILNPHRALVLKSPVFITAVNDWKKPKKYKGKNKFYVERRYSMNHKDKLFHIKFKPSFICCHSY